MKIALTKGTLRVPPTYFALTHAERMRALHEFEMFCLVADVQAETSVPINDYVPARRMKFRSREVLMPAFIPRMVRGVKRFQPDVVHQHFGTWSLAAVEAARRSSATLVTTLHGADVFALKREASTAMARWHHLNLRSANLQSKKLLAVSNFLAGEAVGAGFDSNKLEVHYQGVDTDFFTPDADVPQSASDLPTLLFVGGLSERKGVRDLVYASIAAQKKTPHQLVIAGVGELDEEIRAIIGTELTVKLVGSQDRLAVRELMRNAHALVVPSREHKGWREAAGLVALEASACGTPVIASDCGGLREMLVDGSTGVLVPEGDRVELEGAIRQMLTLSLADYQAMSAAARTFAEQERSLHNSCMELARHYEEAV